MFNKAKQFNEPHSGNPISTDEVPHAMRHMKANKVAAPHDLNFEIFQTLRKDGLHMSTSMFTTKYDTGNMPTEWNYSTLNTLPKSTNASDCADFGTLSLFNHCLEIILKILSKRLEGQMHPLLSHVQYGFMLDRGTKNAVFVFKTFLE